MWWWAILWRVLLLIHIFCGFLQGDGNVGCVFNDALCLEDIEWCYDDLAFGKCLQESVEDEDLYKYDLTPDRLKSLDTELKNLILLGFNWSDSYTQCRIQALLYAFRHKINLDLHICNRFMKDKERQMDFKKELEEESPEIFGKVNDRPPYYNPYSNNEIDDNESPPYLESNYIPETYFKKDFEEPDYPDINNYRLKKSYNYDDDLVYLPAMQRRSNLYPSYQVDDDTLYSNRDNFDNENLKWDLSRNYKAELTPPPPPAIVNFFELPENSINEDPNLDRTLDEKIIPIMSSLNGLSAIDSTELVPALRVLNRLELTPEDINFLLKPENSQLLKLILTETVDNLEPNMVFEILNDQEIQDFRKKIAKIREDMYAPRYPISKDDNEIPEQRVYYDDLEFMKPNDDIGSGDVPKLSETLENAKNSFEKYKNTWHKNQKKLDNQILEESGIYTEGGMIFVPESQLNEKDNWGFKRHERLDVKKPGPLFIKKITDINIEENKDNENSTNLKYKKSLKKIEVFNLKNSSSYEDYDVDTSYIYLEFKENIETWNDGILILETIQKLLRLSPGALHNVEVERNGIIFQLRTSNVIYNATRLVKRIEQLKKDLYDQTGMTLVSAGLGNKTKLPLASKLDWSENNPHDVFIGKVLLACIFAAIIMATITLGIVWKHTSIRKKLQSMRSAVDSEASRDYQDLCRTRMATKVSTTKTPASTNNQGTNEKHEVHGRITSLSKESDQQSPSNRSSTSSWSEEPVISNMDISTGHMVLTYMEDHLKNKDRLEQEWVALCAYEAEPCSTETAQKKEHADKNRYSHVLPYDHSRVVLGKLSNAKDMDYINASTITDHDPRNPAYLATQGPLSNTVADFWQMVWEQGSVVMVMLTRLTENGKVMCHRYWPEEGSEVYHIYEVHLVSEHIWCDDYLVRSFYLKNTKTGETRTVTQFHFLSWPENSVPASTKALLEFRRKVNKSYRGRSCPIIVHCSDGAGRTGTYCLIDMVLNRMSKGAKEIDIAATLEHIRDQRPGMVTTKQQFEFVLMAVAEEVHAILKALPAVIEKQEQPK